MLYLNHSCLPHLVHGPSLICVCGLIVIMGLFPPLLLLTISRIRIMPMQPSQAHVMKVFINISPHCTCLSVYSHNQMHHIYNEFENLKKKKKESRKADNKWVLLVTTQTITKYLEVLLGHVGAKSCKDKACLSWRQLRIPRGCRVTWMGGQTSGSARHWEDPDWPMQHTWCYGLFFTVWINLPKCSWWSDGKHRWSSRAVAQQKTHLCIFASGWQNPWRYPC